MNFKKTISYKCFIESKYSCIKYTNYFEIYDRMFGEYQNKKITFVEIGVFSGGSLFMWKNFFGNKARIIGIDLNPQAKQFEKYGFEIFIGDQSDKNFWKNFFKQIGKVDIVLDDGGHTNYSQIMTTNCCIPMIKNNGKFVVEDIHTSFLKKKFYNPSKFSFINYSKKLVEDINTRFSNIKKFKFSLNNFIYKIDFYESIVCFNINRNLCKNNKFINNKKKSIKPIELRSQLTKNSLLFKIKKIFNLKTNFTFLIFKINEFKLKKYFK